jgi:hypothetical protein
LQAGNLACLHSTPTSRTQHTTFDTSRTRTGFLQGTSHFFELRLASDVFLAFVHLYFLFVV